MPLLVCDNVCQLITAECGFLHTQTKPRLRMTARLSLSLDLHDLAGLSTSLHVYQSCNGSDVGFSRDPAACMCGYKFQTLDTMQVLVERLAS